MFLTSVIPSILFGSVVGVFVDRWSRKWTMVVVDLLRAGLLLPMLLIQANNMIWMIYLLNFLISTCALFFNPARGALMPLIVSEDELLAANALGSISTTLPNVIGPLLAGFLLVLPGGLLAVVVGDSATFVCSALMIFLIALPKVQSLSKQTAPSPSVRVAAGKVWKEWIHGLKIVRQQRPLVILFLIFGVTSLAECPLIILLAPFTTNILHGNSVTLAWFIVARGIGGLLGSLLMGSLHKVIRPLLFLLLGTFASGCCFLLLAHYPVITFDIIGFMGIDIFTTMAATGSGTLLQQWSIDAYRGRVLASYVTVAETFQLLGFLAVSVSSDALGILLWLYVAGFLYLGASLLAGTTWRVTQLHHHQ